MDYFGRKQFAIFSAKKTKLKIIIIICVYLTKKTKLKIISYWYRRSKIRHGFPGRGPIGSGRGQERHKRLLSFFGGTINMCTSKNDWSDITSLLHHTRSYLSGENKESEFQISVSS